MSDPLSVAAGMSGALTVASRMSSTLQAVRRNTQDPPRQVASLLEETRGTAEVLSSLQSSLLGREVLDRSRTKLLRVESVVAVLTGCVSTFSQLQEVIDYLQQDDQGFIDRAKWVARETTLGALIIRLQTHKSALFLIAVGVLNAETTQEVERSVARLNAATKHQYQQILDRLRAYASQQPSATPRTSPYSNQPTVDIRKLHISDVGPAVGAFKLALTKGEVYLPEQYAEGAQRAEKMDMRDQDASLGDTLKGNLKSLIGRV